RILPQYRALRAKLSSFKELVETPELACEVTLQPVDEIGVDAAIIFSDILVIPEAMGLGYEMIPGKGPIFPMTVQSEADVDNLLYGDNAASHLTYVYNALKLVKSELNGKIPLIGFAGAPWTIFAYMIEGSGSKTFSKAKSFLYTQPGVSHALLQKITDSTIAYLKLQVQAGADILQVFDSWAGILSPAQYQSFALPYLKQICDAIQEVPITMFAKGAWFALEELGQLDCQVIGLDWNTSPAFAKKFIENKSFQGNLDPCFLYAEPERIKSATWKMLLDFKDRHIVNLGHGVYPDTPLDNVKVFVEAAQSFEYT
ncbi:MAG: uroporphyrinogen decarboxylase, partial [Bacteroidota bacterium]